MRVTGAPAVGRLILASASPRRQDLLRQAGIDFEVVVAAAGAEPGRAPGEPCHDLARRAAEAKARSVAVCHPGRCVLGADTVVAVDDEALGKPADELAARHMLRQLSGRRHHVYTGVAIARAQPEGSVHVVSEVVATTVVFHRLSEATIAAYVRTGEPLDKAGGYGIQGRGKELVARYHGSYTNVVGLPLEAVHRLLQATGGACPAGGNDCRGGVA